MQPQENMVSANLEDKARALTDCAMRIIKTKPENHLSEIKIVADTLSKAGMPLKSNSRLLTMSLADGNAGGAGASPYIGQNTFQVLDSLNQDISPNRLITMESPYNMMLPFRNIDSITAQQDIYESSYGATPDSQGYGGGSNILSLLDSYGKVYSGYASDETMEMTGWDLIALREMGASDTRLQGAMQKWNLSMLNLVTRLYVKMELTRIDALNKGSFMYNGRVISTQIPSANVYSLTTGMFTYHSVSNYLSVSPTAIDNFIDQLSGILVRIQAMSLQMVGVLLPYTIYWAIYQTLAVQGKTQYFSAVSNNNVGEIRKNVFRIANVPALENIEFILDNRTWKTEKGLTTPRNTRPLMYGSEIDAASFRALIMVAPTETSRVGEFAMFPNLYARTSPINGNTRSMDGGVTVITQDLSTVDASNQKLKTIASAVFCPKVDFPSFVFPINFPTTIVAD